MMTAQALRQLALSLPEATENETWGEATFRVRNKIFVTLSADGALAGLKATLDEQAGLVASMPMVFSVAHYTGRYGWVTVQLSLVDEELMHRLVIDAWRQTAPKRLAAAYDAEHADDEQTP